MSILSNIGSDMLLRASMSRLKYKLLNSGKTDELKYEFSELNEMWILCSLEWFPGPIYASLKLEYDSLLNIYNSY